jgi:hypothetical protein
LFVTLPCGHSFFYYEITLSLTKDRLVVDAIAVVVETAVAESAAAEELFTVFTALSLKVGREGTIGGV